MPEGQKRSSFGKIWDILFPFLLYYLVRNAAQLILLFLMNACLQLSGGGFADALAAHAPAAAGAVNGLSMIIGLCVIFPMAKREIQGARPVNGLWQEVILPEGTRPESRPAPVRLMLRAIAYLPLAVLAVTSAVGLNLLLQLTGFVRLSAAYGQTAAIQYGSGLWIGIALYGILSPLVEETVFRGIIYNRMKKYFAVGISLVFSSLLFGIYHGNLVQGVYGFLMGLLITYGYEAYRSFAAPFLFHVLANTSVYLLTYYSAGAGGLTFYDRLLSPPVCAALLAAAGVSLAVIGRKKAT